MANNKNVRIGISKIHNMFDLDGYYNPTDYEKIYTKVFEITNNHEEAVDIASWCELATVGETYEVSECTIFVIDYEEMREIDAQISKGW